MARFLPFLILLCFPWIAQAQDGLSLTGKVSEEGGLSQSPSVDPQSYQYGRLLLGSREDLTPELALAVEGEAAEQSGPTLMSPLWLSYTHSNLVPVEADNAGDMPAMARLDRTFLKWTSGRLELTAGLQSFDNGSINFYSPTHYFDPLSPLAWTADEPLGSEGVNADCFLFDDLSLEGSVRWLGSGTNEWVVRLVDRGIGITATPSFAHLSNRDGIGELVSGTFPDFQLRWEGVSWFSNGTTSFEWIGAVSALIQKTQCSLEALQDATGEALGPGVNGVPGAFYLFASAQRDLPAQWKAEMKVVKSTEGGPWLFWPRVTWAFEPRWELGFQGQWLTANNGGPLGTVPAQSGLSLTYDL